MATSHNQVDCLFAMCTPGSRERVGADVQTPSFGLMKDCCALGKEIL